MSTTPEAFLFDLDGVLRTFEPATSEIERRHGVEVGTVEEIAYAPERYGPALLGRITDEDWRASVVAALVPICGGAGEAIELVVDWSARVGRVDSEALEVVTGLRERGVAVGLVVNGTTRLELDLVVLGLLEAVDAVVNSARTGVAKPDAEMYEIAAGILTARPQRCVYVGSAHQHVAGAERVGMKGHLYDGVAGLRAMIAERLPTG